MLTPGNGLWDPARSDDAYMGGPPLPRLQRMDMLHIIIEWLPGFSECVTFIRMLIVSTPLEENGALDETTTVWYASV